MESERQSRIVEEGAAAAGTFSAPSLVQQPSDGDRDEEKQEIKYVKAAGPAGVGDELDHEPGREQRRADNQASAHLANT